jgi:hypothetical protein
MLANDPKRLRWCGIDMRPRWRRRVAVVVTYVGVAILCAVAEEEGKAAPLLWFAGAAACCLAWCWLSVFRLVKGFEEEKRNLKVRGFGEMVRLNGLDDWARYRFGVDSFDAASAEQQSELLNGYKVGMRYMLEKFDQTPPLLDEREQRERDGVERWTRQATVGVLASYAGIYASRAMNHDKVDNLSVALQFMSLSLLVRTLPMARILWIEPEPWQNNELGLVPVE